MEPPLGYTTYTVGRKEMATYDCGSLFYFTKSVVNGMGLFLIFKRFLLNLAMMFSRASCTRLTAEEQCVFSPTESLRNLPRRSIIIANAETNTSLWRYIPYNSARRRMDARAPCGRIIVSDQRYSTKLSSH